MLSILISQKLNPTRLSETSLNAHLRISSIIRNKWILYCLQIVEISSTMIPFSWTCRSFTTKLAQVPSRINFMFDLFFQIFLILLLVKWFGVVLESSRRLLIVDSVRAKSTKELLSTFLKVFFNKFLLIRRITWHLTHCPHWLILWSISVHLNWL